MSVISNRVRSVLRNLNAHLFLKVLSIFLPSVAAVGLTSSDRPVYPKTFLLPCPFSIHLNPLSPCTSEMPFV